MSSLLSSFIKMLVLLVLLVQMALKLARIVVCFHSLTDLLNRVWSNLNRILAPDRLAGVRDWPCVFTFNQEVVTLFRLGVVKNNLMSLSESVKEVVPVVFPGYLTLKHRR